MNGCHNRAPFAAGYWAQDGYHDEQRTLRKSVWIAHDMTTDCQYTKTREGQADAGCAVCPHKQ